jgi:hypothetical protein
MVSSGDRGDLPAQSPQQEAETIRSQLRGSMVHYELRARV